MNDEMFRLALIDITNDDLLNDFINDIFGYDFDLKRKEYVYIQYKIVEDNIILNIYDNKNSNRFKAYIFTLNDIDNDENSKYINVKKEYDKYKSGNRDKLCLLSSLLFTKDNNEKLLILYLVIKLKIYLVIIFFNYWFYLVLFFDKTRGSK